VEVVVVPLALELIVIFLEISNMVVAVAQQQLLQFGQQQLVLG
jgi:hypothetical protein